MWTMIGIVLVVVFVVAIVLAMVTNPFPEEPREYMERRDYD